MKSEYTADQLATVYQLSRMAFGMPKLSQDEQIDIITQIECVCETSRVDIDSLIEADAKTILSEVSKMIEVPPLSLDSPFVNPRLH